MKEFIKWNNLNCDTVNGYGIQIIYSFTSFNPEEIQKVKDLCVKHIKEGVQLDIFGMDITKEDYE